MSKRPNSSLSDLTAAPAITARETSRPRLGEPMMVHPLMIDNIYNQPLPTEQERKEIIRAHRARMPPGMDKPRIYVYYGARVYEPDGTCEIHYELDYPILSWLKGVIREKTDDSCTLMIRSNGDYHQIVVENGINFENWAPDRVGDFLLGGYENRDVIPDELTGYLRSARYEVYKNPKLYDGEAQSFTFRFTDPYGRGFTPERIEYLLNYLRYRKPLLLGPMVDEIMERFKEFPALASYSTNYYARFLPTRMLYALHKDEADRRVPEMGAYLRRRIEREDQQFIFDRT